MTYCSKEDFEKAIKMWFQSVFYCDNCMKDEQSFPTICPYHQRMRLEIKELASEVEE